MLRRPYCTGSHDQFTSAEVWALWLDNGETDFYTWSQSLVCASINSFFILLVLKHFYSCSVLSEFSREKKKCYYNQTKHTWKWTQCLWLKSRIHAVIANVKVLSCSFPTQFHILDHSDLWPLFGLSLSLKLCWYNENEEWFVDQLWTSWDELSSGAWVSSPLASCQHFNQTHTVRQQNSQNHLETSSHQPLWKKTKQLKIPLLPLSFLQVP